VLVRRLTSGPYEEDIICPDGTRTFVRRDYRNMATAIEAERSALSLQESLASQMVSEGTYVDPSWGESFHYAVQKLAPEGWTHVTLFASGGVKFYTGEPGDRGAAMPRTSYPPVPQTNPEDEETVSPFSMESTTKRGIDAETQARVAAYSDGRVIVEHTDGLREVVLGDGTRIVSHPSRNSVYIERDGVPAVEYDLECEGLSRKASLGEQIPLNKGGINTRVRLCLPDGSAVVVKYDTRTTSEVNGSIRLVRRDRALIDVQDGGVVTFAPPSAWTNTNEEEYQKDLADTMQDVEVREYGRIITSNQGGDSGAVLDEGASITSGLPRMGGTLDAASSILQTSKDKRETRGGRGGYKVGFEGSSSTSAGGLGLDADALKAVAKAAAMTANTMNNASPHGAHDRKATMRKGGVVAGLSVQDSEVGQDSLIQSAPKETKFTFDIEFRTVQVAFVSTAHS
jgi:hypothetical protein